MTVYGSKQYYTFTYGSATVANFNIYPFIARSADYGCIELSWFMPTYNASFSKLLVLRSPIDYPTTADDGDLIYQTTKTALSTAGSGLPVTLTGVSSTGTKFTVSSTANISEGQTVSSITAGTGTLDTSDITAITQIIDSTTFIVNVAPTVNLSGATIIVSDSMLGEIYTYKDYGSYIDQLSGLASSVYTGTVDSSVTNSKYVSLKMSDSNIKINQRVSYTSSGLSYGPNSGSGIIGGTTVAAINGKSLTLSDYANIPAGTTLNFYPNYLELGRTYYYSVFVYTNNYWQRVGTAVGVSANNYNTANIMYDFLPEAYKSTSALASFGTSGQNTDLYNFLRTFAFSYDLTKTMIDNAKNRYDIKKIDGRLIPSMLNSFGFNYETVLGLSQARRLLQFASNIYLNKGSITGIKEFIGAFAGYNVSIGSPRNLLLTTDCSSFETGTGFWDIAGGSGGSTIASTTMAIEGTTLAPYVETNSTTGYLNGQKGYLKLSVPNTGAPDPELTFSYGMSLDRYAVDSSKHVPTVSNGYITFFSNLLPVFKTGGMLNVKGFSPASVNGTYKVIYSDDTGRVTVENTAVANGTSITGTGSLGIFDPVLYGVPVTSGTYYKFSVYTSASVTNSSIMSLGVKWYDKFGSYLTYFEDSSYGSGPAGSWISTFSTPTVAPSRAAYAIPYLKFSAFTGTPDVTYIDAAQFESSKGAAYTPFVYTDARRIDLYLQPTRANEAINPGFESSVKNWSVTGGSIALESGVSNVYPTSSVGSGLSISTGSAKITASTTTTTVQQLFEISNVSISTNRLLIGTSYSKYGTVNLTPGQALSIISGAGTFAANTVVSSIETSSVFYVNTTPTSSGTATIGVSGNKVLPNQAYSLSAYVKGTAGATVVAKVEWKNKSGTLVQTDISDSITLTSSFQRVTLTPKSKFATVAQDATGTSVVIKTDVAAVSGQSVRGNGIASGTTVSSYNSTTKTITLSIAAAIAAGTTITIGTMLSPADAAVGVISFVFTGANGNIYYLDSVLFELSTSALTYFDGGTGYRMTDDLLWENYSSIDGRGIYYKNRSAAITRLNSELTEYIPMGATFALITGRSATS